MSLNDDVDEGLEPFIEPNDINGDQAIAPSINLITKTDTPKPSDNNINAIPTSRLFGPGLVKNELPNLDAEFTIITDTTNKIADITGIKNTIESSCGVCQEDASAIDSVVPGFISDDRPLGYFTEDKTKTQYTQTLNSLNVQIEANIEKLKFHTLDTTEKLVNSYRELAKACQQAITDSLVKNQLVLAELTIIREGEGNSDALNEFLCKLDKRIPHMLDEYDEDPFIQKVMSVIRKADVRANITNVSQPYRTDVVKAFEINGVVYEFSEEEPYLVVADVEVRSSFGKCCSFLDYLYNGNDMTSINYMQQLCQLSLNLTEAMVKSAALIEDINKKPMSTLKEKMDVVTQVVAVNNRYAKQNAAVLGFMTDYFKVFDYMADTVMSFKKPTV